MRDSWYITKIGRYSCYNEIRDHRLTSHSCWTYRFHIRRYRRGHLFSYNLGRPITVSNLKVPTQNTPKYTSWTGKIFLASTTVDFPLYRLPDFRTGDALCMQMGERRTESCRKKIWRSGNWERQRQEMGKNWVETRWKGTQRDRKSALKK